MIMRAGLSWVLSPNQTHIMTGQQGICLAAGLPYLSWCQGILGLLRLWWDNLQLVELGRVGTCC